MGNWRERLLERATPRATFGAILLYLASIAALTHYDARIARHAAITKPDLHFGYRLEDILATFGALGAGGRTIYGVHLVIDTIMPLAFAAAALLVVARAVPRLLAMLAIAPLAFMTLDVLENAAFAVMLQQYPEVSPALVAATSKVTMVKLVSFGVALPTLVVAGARFLWLEWRALRGRQGTPASGGLPAGVEGPPA